MKERSNTPLLVIGMAAIVIPLCCYLMVLSSLPDVWMKGSFDRYMGNKGIIIPSVSSFKKYMNFLPGQDGYDYGSIFLKSGSIDFASFKDEDNWRKGFKFETIGLSDIKDRLDNTGVWLDSLERYSYPLRTFVDKDMPMKEVLSVLYRIRPSRPSVAFVLRDRDTSGYIFFHYRIMDSIATIEAYKSLPLHSVEVNKESDCFTVVWQKDLKWYDAKLTDVFEDMLSSRKAYVLAVDTRNMSFEDCISVVYEYVRIVHKYRNDYCLKTYGKPFEEGPLNITQIREVKALFPQNILVF